MGSDRINHTHIASHPHHTKSRITMFSRTLLCAGILLVSYVDFVTAVEPIVVPSPNPADERDGDVTPNRGGNTPGATSPVGVEPSVAAAELPAHRIAREQAAATEAGRINEGLCNFILQETRRYLVQQFDEEYVKRNIGNLMHPQVQFHYGMPGALVFLRDEDGREFAESSVYTIHPAMLLQEHKRLQDGGISVAKVM